MRSADFLRRIEAARQFAQSPVIEIPSEQVADIFRFALFERFRASPERFSLLFGRRMVAWTCSLKQT